jgi:serine phosphatase RsbU (regulator of sigma subunit)
VVAPLLRSFPHPEPGTSAPHPDPGRTEDPEFDHEVNILLVDDQPANLLALEAVLAGPRRRLVKAQSGREALRCLLNEDFAVILMDVKMPEMDGFETAALIHQRNRSRHTPIIFLTAFETDAVQMAKGYALGAVDYLPKPIVPEVLRAKVAAFVEIFRKTEQLKRQAELLRQLEQREHERQLAEAKKRWEAGRLREEIRIARQIQQKLFPAAQLPLPGFDVSGASCPAEATGGDYFDYIPLRDGSLGVVIGDVSGHGFGPALLMAEMRAYLRAFTLTHSDLAEIVGLLNVALANDDLEDRFATLLLARLEPRTRAFTYVSAGHTAGYVLDAAGAVKAPLPSTGMPLAIMPSASFPAAPAVTLGPGEGVLLITDGIIEAHSPDEALFGAERTLATVQASWQRSARQILSDLYEAVRVFRGVTTQFDDMTAIVIKVNSSSERPAGGSPPIRSSPPQD